MKNSPPCLLFVGEWLSAIKILLIFQKLFVSTMKTVSFIFEKQEEIRRLDNKIKKFDKFTPTTISAIINMKLYNYNLWIGVSFVYKDSYKKLKLK